MCRVSRSDRTAQVRLDGVPQILHRHGLADWRRHRSGDAPGHRAYRLPRGPQSAAGRLCARRDRGRQCQGRGIAADRGAQRRARAATCSSSMPQDKLERRAVTRGGDAIQRLTGQPSGLGPASDAAWSPSPAPSCTSRQRPSSRSSRPSSDAMRHISAWAITPSGVAAGAVRGAVRVRHRGVHPPADHAQSGRLRSLRAGRPINRAGRGPGGTRDADRCRRSKARSPTSATSRTSPPTRPRARPRRRIEFQDRDAGRPGHHRCTRCRGAGARRSAAGHPGAAGRSVRTSTAAPIVLSTPISTTGYERGAAVLVRR